MKSSNRVGVGVVGCGGIAHRHLAILSELDFISTSYVCDLSLAVAQFAQQSYGFDHATKELESVLASPEVDVVHVLTPAHTHLEIVSACLNAEKHVVCEKPLAPDLATARKLYSLATSRSRALLECQHYLMNTPVRRIDNMVSEGRIGELKEIDLTLSLELADSRFLDPNLSSSGVSLPGGVLQDFLPHLSYLALHFFGEDEVIRVDGNRFSVERQGGGESEVIGLDALVASRGKRGRLRVSPDVKPDMFRLSVHGEKGFLETDLFNPYMRFEGAPNLGKRTALGRLLVGAEFVQSSVRLFLQKVARVDPYEGMRPMLERFYNSLDEGYGFAPERKMSLKTADLIDQINALPCHHY